MNVEQLVEWKLAGETKVLGVRAQVTLSPLQVLLYPGLGSTQAAVLAPAFLKKYFAQRVYLCVILYCSVPVALFT
jgi:hypothetical protein